MRKIFTIFIAAVCTFSCIGCAGTNSVADDVNGAESTVGTTNVESNNQNEILVAYFSRWGNTYFPSDVDATTSASIIVDNGKNYGTTEYAARMVSDYVGGTLYPITVKEAYPTDYQELVDKNHQEMQDNYLPELSGEMPDMSKYETVFICYPIWATDVPQAVRAFIRQCDMSGKTVIPLCTHAGYGAGNSFKTIADESKSANVREGLAVEADDVRTGEAVIHAWLESIGFPDANSTSAAVTGNTDTFITVTVGNHVLEAVLYDTPLANEIKAQLPLSVSTVGYIGREYYGSIDFTPVNQPEGQLYFSDGDITYCGTNNSLAIFYSQADRPNLTMEVVPIGKIISDLGVFDTLGSTETITFSINPQVSGIYKL